jgi:hypothetical protein
VIDLTDALIGLIPDDGTPISNGEIKAELEHLLGAHRDWSEAQGWSLNPGRYVGVATGEGLDDEEFKAALQTQNQELGGLNTKARELEATIWPAPAGM